MSQVLQNSRRKPRPWTAQEQVTAEVAAACGVQIKEIGLAIDRDPGCIRIKLSARAAASARKSMQKYAAANRDKRNEQSRVYRAANVERSREMARRWHALNSARVSQRKRKNYEANRDSERRRNQEWHANNRDAVSARKRRYLLENLETLRERNRKWIRENPCKALEMRRKYIESHREQMRENSRKRKALRRASRRVSFSPLSRSEQAKRFHLWQNHCAYCDASGKMTLDHVLSLACGGLDEASNIVPACARCNSSKRDRPVESWYRAQQFFSVARWAKIQRHCPSAVVGQLPLALPA